MEIERLRYVEVPPALTAPVELPALPLVDSNRALLAERDACMVALDTANGDKAEIATIQGKPVDERRD